MTEEEQGVRVFKVVSSVTLFNQNEQRLAAFKHAFRKAYAPDEAAHLGKTPWTRELRKYSELDWKTIGDIESKEAMEKAIRASLRARMISVAVLDKPRAR